MATLAVLAPYGLSLSCKLFPAGSDVQAGSTLSLTEATNRQGYYTASVSGLSGLHSVHFVEIEGVQWVELTDDAGIYEAGEKPVAVLTQQMPESYAADGVQPTAAQSLYLIMQGLLERVIDGTTETIRKLDKVTPAAVYNLNDAANPTDKTRAS